VFPLWYLSFFFSVNNCY